MVTRIVELSDLEPHLVDFVRDILEADARDECGIVARLGTSLLEWAKPGDVEPQAFDLE